MLGFSPLATLPLATLAESEGSGADIEDNGGDTLTLTDASAVLPVGDEILIYAVIDDVEYPCYSGVAGQGYRVIPEDAGSVDVITPPLPAWKHPLFRARTLTGTLIADFAAPYVFVVNRYFRSKTFGFRSLFMPSFSTGPRSLSVADALDMP